MPLLMQSKVLRAIQEKEFQRIGGNQTIKSDALDRRGHEPRPGGHGCRAGVPCRLVFPLERYTIVLPPLRERREDIPLLVDHYLRIFNAEIGKAITSVAPEAMQRLVQYSWPGNIRELQTVLKHAMLHAIGPSWCRSFFRPNCGKRPRPRRASRHGRGNRARRRGPLRICRRRAAIRLSRHSWRRNFARNALAFADSVKYMEFILLTLAAPHEWHPIAGRCPLGDYAGLPPQ